MRIATFNIRHGEGADGGAGRVEELVAACESLSADVLALQEVDRGVGRSGGVDQAAKVAEALGASYTFGTTTRIGDGDYGNALLVRGELADVRHVALPRRFRSEPRAVIVARATVGGVPLSIAATHLTTDNDLAREQLEAVLDLLASMPHPRVLVGDLNLPPGEVLPYTTAEGYQLVRTGPTFPNEAPRVQIDAIAVTGLEAHDVEVVATPVSDHRAVVVELSPT